MCSIALVLNLRAGEFINLGFELADTNSVIYPFNDRENPSPTPLKQGFGPVEQLLPGWQLRLGDVPLDLLGLDAVVPIGGIPDGFASLVTPLGEGKPPFTPFEGNFGLYLIDAPSQRFTLSQRGEIPSN